MAIIYWGTDEIHDYEFWGSYSTRATVEGPPLVVEREFGERLAFTGRTIRDKLVRGVIEQVAVDGGDVEGFATLSINGRDMLQLPFCGPARRAVHYGRVELRPHIPLRPGDKWRWMIEAPKLPADKVCGVDVLVGIRTFWEDVPSKGSRYEYFHPVHWCSECTVQRDAEGILMKTQDVTEFVEGVVRCVDPDDLEPGALVQWYQCPRCGHRWSVLDRSGKP